MILPFVQLVDQGFQAAGCSPLLLLLESLKPEALQNAESQSAATTILYSRKTHFEHVQVHVPCSTNALLICSEVLQSSGSLAGAVSEKGLLQLLFDVRFLSDALVGGRPLNDTPPAHPPPLRYQLAPESVCHRSASTAAFQF